MTDPLAAAVAIGDALCAASIRHEGRCTWIGPRIEETERGVAAAFAPLGGSLYGGTAGVALFLAHLWRATGQGAYRRTALQAGRHAVDRTIAAPSPGLHGGYAGVANAIRRVGVLLRSEEMLVAAPAVVELGAGEAESDLLNGIAGTALGLAAFDGDNGPRALDQAIHLCDELVSRAEWSSAGCSWATGRAHDRRPHLLGLSHGAAGIALALAEVGVVAGRADLGDVARAGFAYERARFDDVEGDWPDLRAGAGDAGGPSFMRAWCHGAPGIALTRLRASEILGDPSLRAEALTALALTAEAIDRVVGADGADFCLCHGLAGNADVLMCGAAALPAEGSAWADLALEVADDGIRRYHDTGQGWPCGWGSGASPALMTGLAGIGLFLLRVCDRSVETPLVVRAGPGLPFGSRSTPPEEVASVH